MMDDTMKEAIRLTRDLGGTMQSLLLLALLGVGLCATGYAQWPNCGWNCTANDIVVETVWLGDSGGSPIGAGHCTPGQMTTAYIWARIRNMNRSGFPGGFFI